MPMYELFMPFLNACVHVYAHVNVCILNLRFFFFLLRNYRVCQDQQLCFHGSQPHSQIQGEPQPPERWELGAGQKGARQD